MATRTGAVGTAGQDTLFKTPVSLGIQLGAGEYPNGTLSFTNIASGGTVWRNNHFTNSLAVWLCLCDSAGNNKVRIGTWNIGANSSSNLKDFTVSNAQALAGKALYLIMEDSGYDWDTRDYTCLRGNTAVSVATTYQSFTISGIVGDGGAMSVSKQSATPGETITVTATPNGGYKANTPTATGITFTAAGTNIWTFTMPAANVTINQTFTKLSYDVIVNAGAGGTAVSNKAQASGGDTVTITCTPNSGYKANTPTASGITFTAAGTNKWTFTMPTGGRVAISCTFSKIDYTISKSVTGSGTVSLSKTTANIGDEITITATPDSGWKVKTITTSPSRTITNNKFTMPAGNVTVTVVFEKINYTVSVTTSGSGTATLSKSTANIGDEITVTPSPSSGWRVKSITTSPSRTVTNNKFTMPASDVTVTVVFEKINYTVTGTKTGTGTLTLSKTTANIGDEITITATPGSGWRLKSLTTNPSRTITNNKFTMPAGNVTVTAVFEKISYTVSISKTPSAGGSVSLSKTTAQIGDEITVTATPATGYRVKSIVTNPSRTVSNNKFTMPAGNVAVTVTFELISYAVTKKISPSGGGTAALSATSAHLGDTITVTPTPANGYQLKSITTNPSRTVSASNQFTMPAAAVEVTIVFEKINYTVSKTVTPNGGGTASLSKTTAQIGDEITVTATPTTGYKLKSITTSPERTVTNNKFTMPAGNVTVTVTFEKITYTVTKTVTPSGAGTVTLSKTSAKMGDTVTVSQTPASGYVFDGWETTPANLISSGQFTMPASNVTVKAKYLKYSTATLANKSLTSNGTVKLTISADKATYKHKYRLNFGTGMTSGWVDVAAGVSEVNVSVPDSWADAIPNATSKTGGTMEVRTYKADGTTLIGTYTISGLTYNVRSGLVPTLTDITTSIARTIGGVTYANVGSYYVQGKCGVAISATAAGVRSSTITKIECTLSGYSGSSYNKTLNNTTALSYTTGLLNIAGTITITVKATDSRGRTATKTKTITVTAYTKPKGTLDVWRVDAGGTTDPLGTYAKYTKTSSFTAVGSNALTVTLKSQNVSKTNPANTGDLLPGSKQNFGQLTEYTIELKLQDSFETVTITAKLPTARFLFYAESSGDRLAFFKAANTSLSKNGKDTVLEFSGDSQIYIGIEKLEEFVKRVIHNVPAVSIPENADLDDYIVPGEYFVESSTIAQTIAHIPATGAGGRLVVDKDYTSSNNFIRQTYYLGGSGSALNVYTRKANGEGAFANRWESINPLRPKNIGTITIAQLVTYLENLMSNMYLMDAESIRFYCSATSAPFQGGHIYSGTLHYVGSNKADVILMDPESDTLIYGRYNNSWTWRKIATTAV